MTFPTSFYHVNVPCRWICVDLFRTCIEAVFDAELPELLSQFCNCWRATLSCHNVVFSAAIQISGMWNMVDSSPKTVYLQMHVGCIRVSLSPACYFYFLSASPFFFGPIERKVSKQGPVHWRGRLRSAIKRKCLDCWNTGSTQKRSFSISP